jgi:hypothetical protein
MEVSTTNAEKDEVKKRFGSVFSTIKKLGFFYNDVAGTYCPLHFGHHLVVSCSSDFVVLIERITCKSYSDLFRCSPDL